MFGKVSLDQVYSVAFESAYTPVWSQIFAIKK